MNAPLRIAPSVCPHDCTSTCALEVEVRDAKHICRRTALRVHKRPTCCSSCTVGDASAKTAKELRNDTFCSMELGGQSQFPVCGCGNWHVVALQFGNYRS